MLHCGHFLSFLSSRQRLVSFHVASAKEEDVSRAKLDALVVSDGLHILKSHRMRAKMAYRDVVFLCICCVVDEYTAASECPFTPRLEAVGVALQDILLCHAVSTH